MQKRRFLSLLLCALLTFALLPSTAYAVTFTEPAEQDTGLDLAQWLIAPNADITLSGTPTFTGVTSACSKYSPIDFGTIGEDHFVLSAGILLTSGDGTPPENNSMQNYTASNNVAGDADIKTYAELSYDTFDASVLEFNFTVPEGTPAVEFRFMFGSDEYAEYMNSNYVDGAIVLVDGVNYAKFSNGSPLKVVSAAEMINNTGLSIEYDGISAPKRIICLLDQSLSTHTVKIAIADTSDSSYDSGLFLSAMKVSHETTGGISTQKSSDATVTSSVYTVTLDGSTGGIASVPTGTTKSAFLASLTKGDIAQTWNTDGLQDTVAEGDTLIVTAEDGTTTVTYTVHLSAVRAVENMIDALPSPAAATDEDILAAQNDIIDTKKAYDALSSSDRTDIDPMRVNKLDTLITRLTALLIIVPEDEGVLTQGVGAAVLVPELASDDTGRVVVELAAEPVTSGNGQPNFAIAQGTLADGGQQILTGYDLSLIKTVYNKDNLQISSAKVPSSSIAGSITVLLPVPEGQTGEGMTVVYIDDDGNVTALPTELVTVNEKLYLSFTTSHFSLYAIVAGLSEVKAAHRDYPRRTLTDEATGLSVTGSISSNASLRVNQFAQDAPGAFGDAVRQRIANMTDTPYLLADVSLTHGSTGMLTLSFPVGGQYEGETLTLLQYIGGTLRTLTALVQDGVASFRVAGLGSIALFAPIQAIDPVTIPKTGGAPEGLGLLPIALASLGAAWVRRRK